MKIRVNRNILKSIMMLGGAFDAGMARRDPNPVNENTQKTIVAIKNNPLTIVICRSHILTSRTIAIIINPNSTPEGISVIAADPCRLIVLRAKIRISGSFTRT
jgi:hypothetical protein